MAKKNKIAVLIIIILAVFLTYYFMNRKGGELPQKPNEIVAGEKELTNLEAGRKIYDFSLGVNSGKIVFVEQANYNGKSIFDIWTINSDGNNKTKLTNGTDDLWFREPAWSADGKKIAYAAVITGKTPHNEIWVMDSDGRNKNKLAKYDGSISKLSWNPDGERIVYLLSLSDSKGLITDQIRTINSDGTEQKRLLNDSKGKDNPSWNPNGNKIIFEISSKERIYPEMFDIPNELWVMDGDGNNKKQLLKDGEEAIRKSAWSPNDDKIFYQENNDIWTINSDGNNKTKLTNGTDDLWFREPAWSADGKKIAYAAVITGKTPHNEIWVMDSDGRNKNKLAKYDGSISKLSWNHNGEKIFFLYNNKIWVIRVK